MSKDDAGVSAREVQLQVVSAGDIQRIIGNANILDCHRAIGNRPGLSPGRTVVGNCGRHTAFADKIERVSPLTIDIDRRWKSAAKVIDRDLSSRAWSRNIEHINTSDRSFRIQKPIHEDLKIAARKLEQESDCTSGCFVVGRSVIVVKNGGRMLEIRRIN